MKNTQKIKIQVGNTCDTHGAMLCEGIEMPTVKNSPWTLDKAFIKIDNTVHLADVDRIRYRNPKTVVYNESCTHYSTCAVPQMYWNEETSSFYNEHKQEIDSLEMLAITK